MSKVEEASIGAILDAIVGTTAPQADAFWDRESQKNVPRFEAVCRWVWDRICQAEKDIDSPYASAKKTARMVENAAGDLALIFANGRNGGDEG